MTNIAVPVEPIVKIIDAQEEPAETTVQALAPFWVSVSRKKKIRRIHKAGGCSVRWDCVWWEDALTMEAAKANAICRKCWPLRTEESVQDAEAEATSSSSSGSEAVIFEPQGDPEHPPGGWDWEAEVPELREALSET